MHPSEIWQGEDQQARLIRALLTPASWLYSLGWQGYLLSYKVGINKAVMPHKPIIVVGNIAVGGSGKTPTALHLAKLLGELGHKVVIGCSGYGSPRAEAASIAPDGPLNPAEWGDEPAMFRWLAPEIPLIVGRRRVLAAELAHANFADHVLIMDDGFQHLPLEKTVSIVLEADNPTNTNCLPAGPYREPRACLERADAIIWNSGAPKQTFWLARSELQFVDPNLQPVAIDRGFALCALGQPQRFLDELSNQINLVDSLTLPDHDPMTSGNLPFRIPDDLPIVVTAKDWVKLQRRTDLGYRQFVIARQEVSIEPKSEFRDWIQTKLHESKEQ